MSGVGYVPSDIKNNQMDRLSNTSFSEKDEINRVYSIASTKGQLQALNTYKNLMKTKIPYGQNYCIWAYFLLDKPSDDGLYGKIIFLGAYGKKEALDKAEEIVKNTGHTGIIVTPSGKWENLSLELKMDKTKWVAEDHETALRLQQEKEIKKENKKKEKIDKIKKDIEEEMRLEDDPATIEHYTHNWYLAVKDKMAINMYKQKLDEMEKAYEKRVSLIRKQEEESPIMESKWLPLLETKMKERDESHIFSSIENSVRSIRPEVLPHLYSSTY